MGLISGSCLCGQIRFECENQFTQFHLCHCTQCQKITGSAHVANLFTKKDNITWIAGREKVKRYDVPGRNISNAFCPDCGSPVPHLLASGQAWIIPAGSLDGEPNMTPQDNIFWTERAPWYEVGLQAKRFDGFPK